VRQEKVETMKVLGFVVVLGYATAALSGAPVANAQADSVTGWTITNTTGPRQDVKSCVAIWNNGGPNELAIEALGGLLTLTVSSQTFDQDKHEEVISLGKAGTGKLTRTARVAARAYGITIDDEVDSLLEKEGPLVLTIKGNDYSFSVPNIPSAIDAVLRCVGEPTKAELAGRHEPSFPLPDGWESVDVAAGCAARLKGDEVDMFVTINNKDQVLLMPARKDWNFWGEKTELTLQIDSQPPLSLEGWKWSNMVLVLLPDDRDVAALRKASVLQWNLPTGKYSAKVHDVGAALDAVAACIKEKSASAHN
jgi:hypothetical protein